MIKCKPLRSVKQTAFMMITFVVLALCTGALSVYGTELGIPVVIGRIAFGIVMIAALYYMIKYSLMEIEYELSADTLTIIKTVGRRRTVMGALDLSMTVALISKAEYKENKQKYGRINHYFNYRQNPFGDGMIYIFEFSGNKALLKFEPNEPFTAKLREAIDNCKKDSK